MTNYSRGADFERKVRDVLISQGALAVIRSAGSRGILDLVAWMSNGDVLFIQCKLNGKISKADKDTLRDMAETVGAKAVVASRPRRGKIQMQRIEGALTPEETRELDWGGYA